MAAFCQAVTGQAQSKTTLQPAAIHIASTHFTQQVSSRKRFRRPFEPPATSDCTYILEQSHLLLEPPATSPATLSIPVDLLRMPQEEQACL
eukprot:6281-Chlamydomonas_euryale.AAC.4